MILLNEKFWEVKTTLKKGLGLFAKKAIAPSTIIGDYLGKVIKTRHSPNKPLVYPKLLDTSRWPGKMLPFSLIAF